MRTLRLVPVLLILLVAAGCTGQARPATNVTATSATLNFGGKCTGNPDGTGETVTWKWDIRPERGQSTWVQQGGSSSVTCPNDQRADLSGYQWSATDQDPNTPGYQDHDFANLTAPVSGLTPCLGYQVQLRYTINGGAEHALDDGDFFTDCSGFLPGVATGPDLAESSAAADALGARVARVEFDVGASASSLDAAIDYYADRGVRVLALANWDDGVLPSQAQAQNLASWADRFGPGGAFWTARGADGGLAVRHIEFGNEDSANYRRGCPEAHAGQGDWWASSCYASAAQTYATRAGQAADAIAGTGRDVGLLVNADDGGSQSSAWVDQMHAAVSNLGTKVDGWSVHPYGPQSLWQGKFDRLIAATGAYWSSSIPIDATEWGLATDEVSGVGQTMYANCNSGLNCSPDNYAFQTNPTYAQAGSLLSSNVSAMRSAEGRLRHFLLFAAKDAVPAGTKRCSNTSTPNTQSCREQFFGGVRSDGSDKGAFSTAVRGIMDD